MEGNGFKYFCQTVGSGLQQRAVERSAYRKKNCAFCACFFQSNQRFINSADSTGNYNLAGAVKVYCLYCFAGRGS